MSRPTFLASSVLLPWPANMMVTGDHGGRRCICLRNHRFNLDIITKGKAHCILSSNIFCNWVPSLCTGWSDLCNQRHRVMGPKAQVSITTNYKFNAFFSSWRNEVSFPPCFCRWEGLKTFNNMDRKPFFCDSEGMAVTKGFLKSYQNFHFYWILGAGHFVSVLCLPFLEPKSKPKPESQII